MKAFIKSNGQRRSSRVFAIAILALVSTSAAWAQTAGTQTSTRPDTRVYESDIYGPIRGDWELTLGGSASNDKNFENGGFSMATSIGYFLTDGLEIALRQDVTFSGFSGSDSWSGSTRGAIDYHFNLDRFRPFVGANFGGFYGHGVHETLAAGLEGGAKYYVKPKTFIFAMVEYQWLFNSGNDVANNFDDGRFLYSLGIGFHF